MVKFNLKSKKGITLIALIITIVVLLILAGVTLNIVLNSGIINKSQTATAKYNEQATKEKLTLALTEYKFKQLAGDDANLESIIQNIGGEITGGTEAAATEWTIELDGFTFTVDKKTNAITSIEPSNLPSLNAPQIGNPTITLAGDSKSAIIEVTVTAKNEGGRITSVKLGDQNMTASGEKYTATVTTNGDKEIKVTETVGTRKKIATLIINVTGIIEPTYTISYNANGGTGTMSDTTGTNPQISSNSFTAPTGKEFKEWNTQANGTGTSYMAGTTLKADQTLYAIWQRKPGIFTKGDEVTVGGEKFYVIEDCDSNSTTVTLLAKYNLNQAGTAQAPNAAYGDTAVAFSSTNYWKNSWVEGTRMNLNNYTMPASETTSNNAIKKAQAYADSKETGAEGRLLTYDEVDSLKNESTALSNIIKGIDNQQGTGSTDYYLRYWLSTGYETTKTEVYIVGWHVGWIELESYNNTDYYGVRPVITVSKTLVQ